MKFEMHEFCRCAPIPCGFSDSEGKIQANATMTELLALNKDAPEMVTLLAEIRTERSPFHMVIKFSSGFNRHSKIWQIDSIPLLSQENGYLGTFFHAHEFLFLSPLEYVDGIKPYTVTMQQPDDVLSHREWQIVFLMMHRFSSKEIGRRLNIFPSTVESHLKTIYRKVDVHSACQLRAFCREKGINHYIPPRLLSSDRQRISSHAVN